MSTRSTLRKPVAVFVVSASDLVALAAAAGSKTNSASGRPANFETTPEQP